MNCDSVRARLAGYLDDGLTGSNRIQERASVREHLECCADCREDLQRFRKLGVMLSTLTKHTPPPDLSVRIKVAAA
jgi:predicted anti-sigma-YlaC factor YlaD